MASSARIDELKQKFDENPRRYFAPLANEFRKAGDLEQAILICEEYPAAAARPHERAHRLRPGAVRERSTGRGARRVSRPRCRSIPRTSSRFAISVTSPARQGDPTSARRWYERVLEADPRNEEIQGLIGALADDARCGTTGVAIRCRSTPSHPRRAPATPVEAFAAAPDAHFASHDSVAADVPELLDLDVALPETTPAATPPAGGRAFGRRRRSRQSAADVEATVGDFETDAGHARPDARADRRRPTASSPPSSRRRLRTSPRSPVCSRRSRTRRASTAPPSRRFPASMRTPGYGVARASPRQQRAPFPSSTSRFPRMRSRSHRRMATRSRSQRKQPRRRLESIEDLLDFDMPVAAAEGAPRGRRDGRTRRSPPSCRPK